MLRMPVKRGRRCATEGQVAHLDRQRLTQPVGALLSHEMHGGPRRGAVQLSHSAACVGELTMSSEGGGSWRLRNSSSVHWGHSITELAGHMSPSVPVAVAGKRACRPEA